MECYIAILPYKTLYTALLIIIPTMSSLLGSLARAQPASAEEQGDQQKCHRDPREDRVIGDESDHQKDHAQEEQIARNSAFVEVHSLSLSRDG